MVGVVIVDKNGALNDVVSELAKYKPAPKIFRAGNAGKAQHLLLLQTPSAVLIDDQVEGGIEVCSFIKSNPILNQIHTVYFVSYEEDIDLRNPFVNQWYVKGIYVPDEVAGSLEQLL